MKRLTSFFKQISILTLILSISLIQPIQASEFKYPLREGWLTFPYCEGKHSLLQWPYTIMEWFANYGHLTADDGSKYVYFVTFISYDPLETVVGMTFPHMIICLIDEDNQEHHSYGNHCNLKRFDRQHAYIETEDGNYLRWKGWCNPFQYELHAKGYGYQFEYILDLDFDLVKRPLTPNKTGFVRQPVGVSGYYCMTRLDVNGSITFKTGPAEDPEIVTKRVTGMNWIDRQWLGASFAANNHYTYEWWCIKLDNNEEAILYRIWDIDNDTIATELFEINHAEKDGTREEVTDYTLDDLDYWTSKRYPFNTYSHGWQLYSPQCGWDLTVTPTFEDQEAIAGSTFWSGSCAVTGTVNDEPVTGVAYAELLYSHSGNNDSGPRLRSLPEGIEEVIDQIMHKE